MIKKINRLSSTQKYKTIISSLHTVYRLINSAFEIKDFLIKLTKLFYQITNASSCSIVIIDPAKKYSIYRTKLKEKNKFISDKKTIINNNIEKELIRKTHVLCKKNILAIPLIAEDIIGFIILKKKMGCFNEFDEELLMTLSVHVVMAIKILELYQEQQNIITGTIKSILILLGNKSHMSTTYTHSDCFLKIIDEIAKRMHLKEEERQSLKYASLLHDMGKISIPYEILTKSTTLTGEEIRVIRQHPAESIQIIKHLKALKPAVTIILHHHEKFDGTGYPSHLKGNRIPLGSRILSVVDAFDAMVFDRPYRKKININTAIEEIKKNNGSQFDPKVVSEFLKIVSTKKLKKCLNKIKLKGYN